MASVGASVRWGRMSRWLTLLLAVCACALGLVACGDDTDDASVGTILNDTFGKGKEVKSGKLDNAIEVDGTDEPSQLLESLDAMQTELRARDEKDADFRGQIGAIHRAQAVVVLDMDGTLYLSDQLFDGAAEFLRTVRARGAWRAALASASWAIR